MDQKIVVQELNPLENKVKKTLKKSSTLRELYKNKQKSLLLKKRNSAKLSEIDPPSEKSIKSGKNQVSPSTAKDLTKVRLLQESSKIKNMLKVKLKENTKGEPFDTEILYVEPNKPKKSRLDSDYDNTHFSNNSSKPLKISQSRPNLEESPFTPKIIREPSEHSEDEDLKFEEGSVKEGADIVLVYPLKQTIVDKSGILKPISKQGTREIRRFANVDDSVDDTEDEELYVLNEEHSFFIHPQSPFAFFLDYFMLLLSFYVIVIVPVNIAFEIENTVILLLENVIDVIFVVDLILNFFIGYFDGEDNLIKNNKKIALNYLTGWFVLDLIASFPTGLVLDLTSQASGEDPAISSSINKATRITRIYRMIKLTKLTKLTKIVKTSTKKKKTDKGQISILEELNINSTKKRLVKFFMIFLFFSHMLTCVWIFLGNSEFPSWITQNASEEPPIKLYLTSLYFNWTSIFSIGYGDIVPLSTVERVYCLGMLFFGIGIYSYSISSLGNLISSLDGITAKYQVKTEVLDDIRVKYGLNQNLYDRLKKYISYDFKTNKKDKYAFINELPKKLRNRLVCSMYEEIINRFHFLANKELDFVCEVMMNMRFMAAFKKEIVIYEGEKVDEIVFVKEGRLSLTLSAKYDELKIIDIRKNEHFGDILALSNQRSPVNVKCPVKHAELMFLKKEDLEKISNKFPDSFDAIFQISSYNYTAMLDVVERKIYKFEYQRRKEVEEEEIEEKEESSRSVERSESFSIQSQRETKEEPVQRSEFKSVTLLSGNFTGKPNKMNTFTKSTFSKRKPSMKKKKTFDKKNHTFLSKSFISEECALSEGEDNYFQPVMPEQKNKNLIQKKVDRNDRQSVMKAKIHDNLKLKDDMRRDIKGFFADNITSALEQRMKRITVGHEKTFKKMIRELKQENNQEFC